MKFAAALRQDLIARALEYARAENLPYCLSYAEPPSLCFPPFDGNSQHGNFLSQSYKSILTNPGWKKRLTKVHTQSRRSFSENERGRWMELDSCASSDALLMNIFCYPGVTKDGKVSGLLGVTESTPTAWFGYKARVPLVNGKFDRTEVDLRLGNVLIEAKLTESDFQSADQDVLAAYRDFSCVFDLRSLPQTEERFLSYQLLRNVLAAFALDCSFCVVTDARRPDLIDSWYAVMKCVQSAELRTRLRISTWQEIARLLPPRPQAFLAMKYGITSTLFQSRRSAA